MKSPSPEAQCAENVFRMQYPLCAISFTNNISRSGWTRHKLWKLLTIYFKNKYCHNSVDWSGHYLQVHIFSWLTKILRFTVFKLMENAIVKICCPWHAIILNPHVEQSSNKSGQKDLSPICHEMFLKKDPSTLWGETLCSCSTEKSCRAICTVNICKEVQINPLMPGVNKKPTHT